jgi:hypothetical protein
MSADGQRPLAHVRNRSTDSAAVTATGTTVALEPVSIVLFGLGASHSNVEKL